jgi:hypothetical protein
MYKHTIYTSYVQYITFNGMSCAIAKDKFFLMFLSINNLGHALMIIVDIFFFKNFYNSATWHLIIKGQKS